MGEQVVYILWHEHERFGRPDSKLLGVYASQEDAEAAQARLGALPGFKEIPNGFFITAYALGQDHWIGGFAIKSSVEVPRKAGGTFTVSASWVPHDNHHQLMDFDLDWEQADGYCNFDVVEVEEREGKLYPLRVISRENA